MPKDALENPGPYWDGVGALQPQFGAGGYNDHLFHFGCVFLFLESRVSILQSQAKIGAFLLSRKNFFDNSTNVNLFSFQL